jgi:Na+/H+ antiporter NhaC
MKKELYIFVAIFLFLTIGMHFEEWMSHPIDHIRSLPDSGAYGIGALHPLVFALAIYMVIWVFRAIFALIKRLR